MVVRLLGPLEVRLGDGPVDLGPRKQRAVLAMLALEPGRTVSADRLAEGLWGDRLPPSAAKMVQLYVSHLRRVLDGDGARIVTRGRGYELQFVDGEIDAVQAERLLEESRPREALALWRGEPLADLADEPFAAAEIRRLEELRLRAVELAIDADLAARRHAELIGELDALVAANPLRERLHAQRMLALYRANRQSEALAAYHAARAALVEEIGVEPGAELQRLHEQILAHDPALDLPAAGELEPVTASQAPPRRRSRAALVVAAALVLAGVLAFGVIRVLEPDGLAGIDENYIGRIDPDGGRITDQYRVGHSPGAVTAGDGSVWVANRLDGTVTRIDRGRQIVTIDVGGAPAALAFGAGSLWVADGQGRTVAQVDPQLNKVVTDYPVGNGAAAVAATDRAVWVASADDAIVTRIDLSSGEPAEPTEVGGRPSALAAGAGAIWVASEDTASVIRLDPRSGTPLDTIPVGNGPSGVAVGAGAVWATNRIDGTVSRIDPDTDRQTNLVPVGREPRAVAADRNGVWVANAGDGTVMRIDPRSRQVTKTIDVESRPSALAVVDGAVWTAALADPATHRGGTLRVSIPDFGPIASDPVSLGPQAFLVYDGLVAYRRAGGSAGTALVADLASDVPQPGPDGRTYRFRLRPNLRFSNGAPVTPEDVRVSLARLLAFGDPGYYDVLDAIPGAARCTDATRPARARFERCDLSEAVETDDAARTITFHLTRPDPDFRHKLHNLLIVPAGSPARPAETTPLPGTGPYMIERWNPRRGGVLVRNPHFHAWSPDRPDGFPDRITIRFQRQKAQIAAFKDGALDIAVFDGPTRAVAPLRARYGARLHITPAPGTAYAFLNVLAAPFDDARVRRALNYAVDRGRLAELLGSETHKPTCQMPPPGLQGYTRSCRFTADPNPAGTWTGPDLARARRLVAASGTRGMKVEFWSARGYEAFGNHFRSVLRSLGYRPSVRTFPGVGEIGEKSAGEPRPRPQLGLGFWAANSLAHFTYLQAPVSCSGVVNFSRFCEPELDARMEQAARTGGPEAIDLWRRVDTALATEAPTVPLLNWSTTSVTAERVDNYQAHPLRGPLLEQLWIK